MKLLCALVVCALFGASIPLPAQAAVKQYQLNIPRQSLDSALKEFAKQTGLQVARFTDTGAAADVGPISGEFPVEKALRELLEESGLTFEIVNERTIAVVSPADRREPTQSLLSAHETKVSEATKEESRSWIRRFRLAQAGTSQSTAENQTADSENQQEDEEGSRKKPVQQEEVIVTATRRAENIQDVPLSIAVITAEEIDRRGLVSAEDYLRGIPGVNQTARVHGQSIIIRGIETSPQSQNFSSGTTVATYFGETPTTNSAGTGGETNVDIKLVDIERVEVLRGPQGTAFGNSSLGGAVRTIPVAPKLDRIEGKVAANYSVTSGTGGDNYTGQAVVNIPLVTDKLAIRAVAYRDEDSGFYRNVAGSDPTFQAGPVARYGAQAFATDEDHAGTTRFTGGRIAALFQANDDLKFTLSYLKQNNEMDGPAFANTATYQQASFQVAPEHIDRGQQHGFIDTDIALTNATMGYNLGWADLLATYSYTKSGTTYGIPATPVGLDWALSVGLGSEHREHSGEVRLTTQLDGAWNFLAGLYAEELDDDYHLTNYWFGDPATNFLAPGERFLGDVFDQRNLKQNAAFGEVSWEFLRRFTLTGGARAYKYDRTVGVSAGGPLFGGGTASAVAADASAVAADASGTSFRANLSYKPSDNAHVYAGWSQGFRLGRPQPGLPPGLCDLNGDGIVDGTSNITIDETKKLASDDVDSYELGSKFSLLDRRMMLAADVYRIEWSGVPFRVLAPSAPNGCGFAYNANGGAARSEGIEFQANLYVTEAFRVDVGSSWVRARLTEDARGVGGLRDDRLPGSPKVNANLGFQYEFDIGGRKAFVRVHSIYVGSFYGNLQESANTKSGGYVKVDATGGVAIGNLNLELFGRNLTNSDDFTWRDVSATRGEFFGYRLRPRTIGLQLSRTF